MEENGKKVFPVNRVMELYEEEGINLTTEQAEKILALSQKLVNILVTHYRTDAYAVDSSTKLQEIS